jgi:ribosomal protein S20
MQESAARSALKAAVTAIKNKDLNAGKDAYKNAVRAIAKAASRGVLPKNRAARKIARLTRLALKALPDVVGNAARPAK